MRTKTHEKLAAGQRSRRTDPVHERDTIRVVSVREDEQTGTCRMLSLPKLGQGDRVHRLLAPSTSLPSDPSFAIELPRALRARLLQRRQ